MKSTLTKDIEDISDIKNMVDKFYSRVRRHETLGPIFEEKIADNWPEHLGTMYKFWATILIGDRSYRGHPFVPHMQLPINEQHFDAWLKMFRGTVSDLFHGPKAEDAIAQAEMIARLFSSKMKALAGDS